MFFKPIFSLKKDVVIGLGEIGVPLYKLLSKSFIVEGYDINPKLIPKNLKKNELWPIRFLHICIPYTKNFNSQILKLEKKFHPQGIVIHSTIKPSTTSNIQRKLQIPVIYSPTRGVHKRMLKDLRRYSKFFAIENKAPNKKWACKELAKLLKKSGLKTKQMSSPITLELGKIVCDTSYYGWLINFAQISKIIADREKVDYNEMWSFSNEIHKFLGNRPKMFPGFIGGHCVIPNLELLNDPSLNQIKQINYLFKKISNI
jgi:UDP-N-acetyl-D-mannosaminuronate dehydrogenase